MSYRGGRGERVKGARGRDERVCKEAAPREPLVGTERFPLFSVPAAF